MVHSTLHYKIYGMIDLEPSNSCTQAINIVEKYHQVVRRIAVKRLSTSEEDD